MFRNKKKIAWKLFSLASVLFIFWMIFLKYVYHSSGNTPMILPASWELRDDCYVDEENNLDIHVKHWGKYLSYVSKVQNTVLYNISTQSCSEKFFPDFESNIRKVMNYKIAQNAPCFERNDMFVFNRDSSSSKTNEINVPIIVTAGSSNHFYEIQALFKSIHTKLFPLYKNLKVIFYDIGLTRNENDAVKKHCKCEVRTFPFQKFPHHVRLREAYAWKPLIIFEILKQYRFVMWLDACIRFHRHGVKDALDKVFSSTKLVGIQLQQSPRWIVSNHTKPDTFTFFNEKECLFNYPELESGWIVIWKNSFTVNTIMRPWIGCALTEHCMTHPYPSFLKSCSRDLWKFLLWTRCHRFDQSILNIILIRIFARYRRLIEFDGSGIAEILRGDRSNYFPE